MIVRSFRFRIIAGASNNLDSTSYDFTPQRANPISLDRRGLDRAILVGGDTVVETSPGDMARAANLGDFFQPSPKGDL
jgi:hypothetical protein